jgi:hypothetical protein
MTEELKERALRAASEVAARLVREGAEAVILTGSWARGDAHPESDLDLRVVGKEKPKRLERHGGFLVSTAWQTEDQHRKLFENPEEVGSIIPGWRSALLLEDPKGVAAKLQREAEAWTWDRVDPGSIDEHVATEITKLAEEVHSLYSNLDQGISTGAAMQRSTVALDVAPVMAVHHRLLYESEKKLWDLVGEKQGDAWHEAQEAALGEHGEDFLTSCVAAFDLFSMAAGTTKRLLSDDQREVVEHARGLSPAELRTRPEQGMGNG